MTSRVIAKISYLICLVLNKNIVGQKYPINVTIMPLSPWYDVVNSSWLSTCAVFIEGRGTGNKGPETTLFIFIKIKIIYLQIGTWDTYEIAHLKFCPWFTKIVNFLKLIFVNLYLLRLYLERKIEKGQLFQFWFHRGCAF